jgi:hypothetical protein
MSPSLHRLLTDRVNIEEVSLNQYMVTALARAVGYPDSQKKKGKNQELLVVKESKRHYRHR